jgi:hypothetical protein
MQKRSLFKAQEEPVQRRNDHARTSVGDILVFAAGEHSLLGYHTRTETCTVAPGPRLTFISIARRGRAIASLTAARRLQKPQDRVQDQA